MTARRRSSRSTRKLAITILDSQECYSAQLIPILRPMHPRSPASPLRRPVLCLLHGDFVDVAERPCTGCSLDGFYGDLLHLPLGLFKLLFQGGALGRLTG